MKTKIKENINFIYNKNGEIKVLNLDSANKNHPYLIKEGFVHVATIDSSIILETILNIKDEKKIIKEINLLRNINF